MLKRGGQIIQSSTKREDAAGQEQREEQRVNNGF